MAETYTKLDDNTLEKVTTEEVEKQELLTLKEHYERRITRCQEEIEKIDEALALLK